MKKNNSGYTHFEIPVSNIKFSSPCTLWVPKKQEDFVKFRLLKFSKFNCYVHFLIENYSYMIREGKWKPNLQIKTMYQEKGIGFNIENFRPFEDSDWSVLKIQANSLNVSRCYLVAMFIELDMARMEENIVITKPTYIIGFRELYNPQKGLLIRTKINFNIPP